VRLAWCHAVLLATCWDLSSAALAEESMSPQMRVVVGYRIDLDNFNLGSFRFNTTLSGSDYRVQGAGHFSILGGLLYDLRTTTASSGKVTSAGPEPAAYMLSYAGGGDSGQLRMTFYTGSIATLSIIPRRERDPREIPVTKNQLAGVLDPIAAAFFVARSNDPNGDLKVCDQTVPVFDGEWRYDLVLAPKRKAAIRKQASTGYASYALVCKVRFKPISGYAANDPNVKVMSYTDDIEVWLVPLSGTDMYVPYHLRLPTDSGLVSVRQRHCVSRGDSKPKHRHDAIRSDTSWALPHHAHSRSTAAED
jgi:hypothetical protein